MQVVAGSRVMLLHECAWVYFIVVAAAVDVV